MFTARAQVQSLVKGQRPHKQRSAAKNQTVTANFTSSLRTDYSLDSVCISDCLLQLPHVPEKFSPQVTKVSSQARTSACHPDSYYSKNSTRPQKSFMECCKTCIYSFKKQILSSHCHWALFFSLLKIAAAIYNHVFSQCEKIWEPHG